MQGVGMKGGGSEGGGVGWVGLKLGDGLNAGRNDEQGHRKWCVEQTNTRCSSEGQLLLPRCFPLRRYASPNKNAILPS